MTTALLMAGLAVMLVAVATRALGRIRDHVAYGLLALSQAVIGSSGFIAGNTVAACISTAAGAWLAWKWWTGGGDDDSKRRARKWSRRFHGVRRTAPAST